MAAGFVKPGVTVTLTDDPADPTIVLVSVEVDPSNLPEIFDLQLETYDSLSTA